MKGQFHGLGVYSWANGASYEGDHVKDQRTGFGVMTYPDGAAFSGIWEDGVHKEFRESRFSIHQNPFLNILFEETHCRPQQP